MKMIELFKTMNAIKRKNINICVVVLECKLSREKIGEFQNNEGEGLKNIYLFSLWNSLLRDHGEVKYMPALKKGGSVYTDKNIWT